MSFRPTMIPTAMIPIAMIPTAMIPTAMIPTAMILIVIRLTAIILTAMIPTTTIPAVTAQAAAIALRERTIRSGSGDLYPESHPSVNNRKYNLVSGALTLLEQCTIESGNMGMCRS
jgi:hypothetical protein